MLIYKGGHLKIETTATGGVALASSALPELATEATDTFMKMKLLKTSHDEPGPESQAFKSTNILDLPTEILHIIFSDVDEQDIISVGSLCRRLNQVAYGYHFFKPRPKSLSALDDILNDPSTFYVGSFKHTKWTFRTFQALRLSFFAKPNILSVNTRFSWSFPDEARQISAFFKSGPSLQSVFIGFPYGPGAPGIGRQWIKKQGELTVEQLIDHRKAIYSLLESLASVRPDPKYNSIMMDFSQGVPLDNEATSPDFPSYDGPLLRAPTVFSFSHCSFLFQRPFLDWTIRSLTACRLRRLVLEDVDIGPHLEHLKFDTLREVVLRSITVTQAQFNAFLSRHPNIVELIIFRIAPLPTDSFKFPSEEETWKAQAAISPGALPRLREITIPGDYLASWLAVPSTIASIRNCRIEGRPSDASLQFIFRELVNKGTVTALHFPLCQLSETSDWLDIPLAERAEPKMKGMVRIDLSVPIVKEWEMTEERMDRITKAIAMFPDVASVSMWPSTGQAGWGTCFRRMLKERCPKLKYTIFDFETYSW